MSPNIPHTPGRKYLISAYFGSDAEPRTVECYVQMAGGTHVGLGNKVKTASGAIQNGRLTWLADLSARTEAAFRVRFDHEGGPGTLLWMDAVMVEPLVGNKIEASNYSRGQAGGVALQALVAAQAAQATADGQIDIYRQPNAPSIGGAGAKVGDYWQDSDDGRWWYCNGSSWVESPDNRLPQVVIDTANANSAANTAQTTANARIRLFVQDAQPTGGTYIVGDQWYRPSYLDMRYFNGTGWSLSTDNAQANADALVLNPAFEQSDLHWSLDGGYYTEASTNAAISGKGLVRLGSASIPNARVYNQRRISVYPGMVLSCYAAVRNLVNGANGDAWVGFIWYNKDGVLLAESVKPYSTAAVMAGTTWKTVGGKMTAPYGAAFAHVTGVVYGHTAGYWCFDNFRASIVDDAPRAATSADNFIGNSNFNLNNGGFPIQTYDPVRNQYVADGWKADQVEGNYATSGGIKIGLEAYDSAQRKQLFVGDSGGTSSPGSNLVYARTGDAISVEAGETLWIMSEGVVDQGTASPANHIVYTYAGVNCYNKEGADIGYIGRQGVNHNGYWRQEGNYAVPAGTAYVRGVVGANYQNTSGANMAVPWATAHCRFRQLVVRRVSSLDQGLITNGTTYGKVGNVDLVDDTGVRRVGLAVKGSRKILGGARNSRASLVAGVASVRTVTALSANSSGQVTVNAHSINISGEVVTYNAVTNAITGLTQGVNYVIFTLDPYLDGGTRTYFAQTSVLSAQQSGEGAVMIGNVTIPTSGTGTGGGPGTGSPGDWCVDIDTVLPDGRLVRDLQVGDLVPCLDVRVPQAEIEQHQVRAIAIGEEDCFRLVTTSLATVVQSASTPMDLPDGRVKRTPEMLGQHVVVLRDGFLQQELVCDLQYVGRRQVVKVDLGNRMFLAGESDQASIATHNVQYKP